MVENEKKMGFVDTIISGLKNFSQTALSNIISSSIISPITDGADVVLENINHRILKVEKRILRKLSSFLVILFGGVFLIFALFFYLKESLGWSNTLLFFSIGMVILTAGLLLKILEPGK